MGRAAAASGLKAFGILGPLEVSVAGGPVTIQGGRRRALLARLLVSANEVVSADRLIEDLWGDAVPVQPLNALQACVSYLRSVLEPARAPRGPASVLITREPGYVLRVAEDELDALRFGTLVDEGRAMLRAGHLEAASERFGAALGQWRGAALAEFADHPWAAVEAVRLEELRAAAVEDANEARLGLRLHHGLVSELEVAVASHPLRERLRAQLMLALYRCGRQAEALRAFADLRRVLAEELGIEPSAELRRLEEAILLQKPELDWQPPGGGRAVLDRAPAPKAHNLPIPVSSFVGRRAELATLRSLLATTRLLTLTGPGGVGKTRLALELGTEVLAEQPDGVWLVELASTSDPSLVPAQVRSALGIPESTSDPLETVIRHLRSRHALLVLDNCEHLIEPCGSLAEQLLRTCAGLRIVATSRERLGVQGEFAWTVPSLSLLEPRSDSEVNPLVTSDAVRLFVERVGAARGGRALTGGDECAVVDICRRLDGIPLALELAAARANVLALPEIAARLSDRLGFVTASSRSTARHRTLRAAIDWTYEALGQSERRLFERVSVFAGGFSLHAAEEVCAGGSIGRHEVLGLLANLTDKSVVSVSERAGVSRYSLLETLRQYGAEKLRERGEEEQLRDSHLAWAALLGEMVEAQLCGPQVRRWLDVLDDEYDNLQSALVWAQGQGRSRLGLQLAAGVRLYWEMRGRVGEGRGWLERLLAEASELDRLVKARALTAASSLAFVQGDPGSAARFAAESLTLAESVGDDPALGRACLAMGNAAVQDALMAADLDDAPSRERLVEVSVETSAERRAAPADGLGRAAEYYERALKVARSSNDRFAAAMALVNLGYLATCEGDLAKARPLLEESLALRRELGNRAYEARSLSFLGLAAHREGRFEEAEALLEESVATLREVRDDRGLSEALPRHADLLRAGKDFSRAAARYREAASVAARLERYRGMISYMIRAAEATALAGDGATAGYLLGVAHGLLSAVENGIANGIPNRERYEQLVVRLLKDLGGKDVERAFEEAKNLSAEEALLYVERLP